ncbi:MAG: GNAT family N-acetyltransferase [Candidatus Fluviicola riflensis]|nr:MAG: GNAT family N-acetyltransferase [Candidatus Fluviicola riflensis]OGS79888.1 MAG: GNAT family N-acetyltransferase [Candidatus Fluviicola riflensis]OGS82403.1 MAG: GNAT family N-acetyltransferase [Fluviicola sp. RIFCSPHIGHO2_01_FULL_43_53]OGS88067.1 MAG: GNAT family N-acetyltransferase [Fluviicola sp. RIFCSPHIGHO2_12_FULL_43_24]
MPEKALQFPPYNPFPTVSNERITLCEILPSDLEALLEICFYDGVKSTTFKEALVINGKIDNDYQSGNSIHWGIRDNESGKLVGTCGYYRGFEKGGELGCVLLPQFRGQGFMAPALQLAANFGLETMNLPRIYAITTKSNLKAVALLERTGFVKTADLEGDDVEYELITKKYSVHSPKSNQQYR